MNKTLILVVEDDRPIRNLIVTTLKTHDYKYLAAENGSSAILEASSHNPDIVLLDLGLPDIEGVEVIKKIRTWSNMPIIVISARSEDTDKITGLGFGADDYVTKPFNVKVLIARCNNLIKNKKRLIAHYAGKTITESPVTEAINERDKELLAKCVNIIKENFENPAFDVTALASELCVGRSKLYMPVSYTHLTLPTILRV